MDRTIFLQNLSSRDSYKITLRTGLKSFEETRFSREQGISYEAALAYASELAKCLKCRMEDQTQEALTEEHAIRYEKMPTKKIPIFTMNFESFGFGACEN